jgi:hypothetical protein
MSEDERDPKASAPIMPVIWQGGDGQLRSNAHVVDSVTDDEREAYMNANVNVCGSCKFFDLEKGQAEMMRQQFPQRLVREEGWKLHHLGAPLEYVGLCGASGGEMATTVVSKACDQYRPKLSALREREKL